jgi:hypothetical protein
MYNLPNFSYIFSFCSQYLFGIAWQAVRLAATPDALLMVRCRSLRQVQQQGGLEAADYGRAADLPSD